MQTVITAALGRARAVLTLLAFILIAGCFSYVSIPKEDSPDIEVPVIYVLITHAGITPEDAERLLVLPMEKNLRSVEGVTEMEATAYHGGASVVMRFEAGFDAERAIQDVRAGVDQAKSDLPEHTEDPTVHHVNVSLFPVAVVTLAGDVPERTLLSLAKRLRDDLEAIPSVLEAEIGGDRDRQVSIVIDPALLAARGLSTSDFSRLARDNTSIAAGAVETGQGYFNVKVPGLIKTVTDILDLPLKTHGDAVVRVRDVATVLDGYEDADHRARVDGRPGLTVSVSKRIGSNIITTVDAVRAVVEASQKSWPSGVEAHITQDMSAAVKNNLSDLQNAVLTAILLVMVVVVGALGIRPGFLVGIAIPGSLLMGVLVLHAMGLTMNTVVLFGLVLTVGMLVDGAIVVTEYAERKMREGMGRQDAYGLAAQRMAWPVISSTATTVAAFLPLSSWGGVTGEFMKYLPITVSVTLSASLLMALLFVPTLGTCFGRSEQGDERRGASTVHGVYGRLLSWALQRPGWVVGGAVGLLALSQGLYALFGEGLELWPSVDPLHANVSVRARGNLSLDEKDALMRQVEFAVLGRPEVASVYTTVGQGRGYSVGKIGMEFTDWRQRRSSTDVLHDIRRALAPMPGVDISVDGQQAGPSDEKPVQVRLKALRMEDLTTGVKAVRQAMATVGGFVDLEDTLSTSGIDWTIRVDRAQAAKYGVDVRDVGNMVRMVTRGLKVADYRPDGADDDVDIVLRFPKEKRTLQHIDSLYVNSALGAVPVSNFVTRIPTHTTEKIHRMNGHRTATVEANVRKGFLVNTQVHKLTAALAVPGILPDGVSLTYKGQHEKQKKNTTFLAGAFSVALFLMAFILIIQFNSFYYTFLILSAVIMSTTGVFLGLLIFDQPFSIIMSGIGVIALAGIVVNNNIVLIDTFDRLRQESTNVDEAILRTGVQRLRPVLLTTVTTVLGLLPMTFMVSVDFVNRDVTIGSPSMQEWAQLSTALVCGLVFTTALTLIVTPCLLKLRAAGHGRVA